MVNDSSNEPSLPDVGSDGATARWRDRLYRCLASQATPVLVSRAGVRSAASLWAGAREWTRRFRDEGIGTGTRVVCVHADELVQLQLLVACLWDGLDLRLTTFAAAQSIDVAHGEADVFVGESHGSLAHSGWHVPAEGGWPDPQAPLRVHASRMTTRGDTRVAALTVECADGAVVTHATLLNDAERLGHDWALTGGRVLTAGLWHTRVGLTAGLLAPLLHAEELFVEHEASAMLALLASEPLTHVVDTAGMSATHLPPWLHANPERATALCIITLTDWPTR